MGLITDLDAIIDANLPDNNSKLITEAKMRTTLKAITAGFATVVPVYIKTNLGNSATYTTVALKVATDRLLVMANGAVVSSAPVNDDPDVPGAWPYPGGATPMSWSHDQAAGTLYLPTDMEIIEIYIRPIV